MRIDGNVLLTHGTNSISLHVYLYIVLSLMVADVFLSLEHLWESPKFIHFTMQEYRSIAACLGDRVFGESDSSLAVSAGRISLYEVQIVLLLRAVLASRHSSLLFSILRALSTDSWSTWKSLLLSQTLPYSSLVKTPTI